MLLAAAVVAGLAVPCAADADQQTASGTITMLTGPQFVEQPTFSNTLYCDIVNGVMTAASGSKITFVIESPMSGTFPVLTASDPSFGPIYHTFQQSRSDVIGGTPAVLTMSYVSTETDCGEALTNVVKSASLRLKHPTKASPPHTVLDHDAIDDRNHTATFTFSAIGNATRFVCVLAKVRNTPQGTYVPALHYRACGTTKHHPHGVTTKRYAHLAKGDYIFDVRAVGRGGTDNIPASSAFTIL